MPAHGCILADAALHRPSCWFSLMVATRQERVADGRFAQNMGLYLYVTPRSPACPVGRPLCGLIRNTQSNVSERGNVMKLSVKALSVCLAAAVASFAAAVV